MLYIDKYISPIGQMILSTDGEVLTGLSFVDDKHFSLALEQEEINLPIFDQTKEWLDCYFRGECPDFMPPIGLDDTPFRLLVWEMLKDIPYGEVITYKCIAERVASHRGSKKMSPQAVGGAVGHNPISIILPCHRVVGTNGSLIGYAAGLEKKIELLRLEQVDTSKMFVPTGCRKL